jgi:hypothetical protein
MHRHPLTTLDPLFQKSRTRMIDQAGDGFFRIFDQG